MPGGGPLNGAGLGVTPICGFDLGSSPPVDSGGSSPVGFSVVVGGTSSHGSAGGEVGF